MTLINAVYVPTGIVMSGDSRTSGSFFLEDGKTRGSEFVVSDATNKVFLLFGRVGVMTASDAYINFMPIEHYVKHFEIINTEFSNEMTVYEIADKLFDYIKSISQDARVYFMIAGYDGSRPCICQFNTGNSDKESTLQDLNRNEDLEFTTFFTGETEVIERLASGLHRPLFVAMNIQDAIDYSRHLIRTTIDQLRFEPRFPTVGGEIDTLLIQPEGGTFIYKKGLTYRI